MAEETATVGAAPSAAATMELPASGTPEYAEWRMHGTLPEKTETPAKADSAAADTSKATTAEDAAHSAAKDKQGNVDKRSYSERIKELNAENKRIKAELEEARKPKETKVDSSTTRPAEQKPAIVPETRPKPTVKDQTADGKAKFATYEDFMEDLADWKAEQRMAARDRERQASQQREALGKHLNEARERYADFDAVTNPVIAEMLKPDIPREVFAVLNDSPVLADLLYTIGGTEASKADFLEACRNNPTKALRVALLMEQEIVKELGAGRKEPAVRGADGQFKPAGEAERPPAKPKTEGAPAPPLEIPARAGGTSESDRALSKLESGDSKAFSAWKRAEDAKELRRRRGA